MDDLLGQLVCKLRQRPIGDPMNAIHRTGVDRLLDELGAVTVLADGSGAAPIRFHHKSMAGHVGAIATANTDRLIHPDSLFAQRSPQQGLKAIGAGCAGPMARGKGQAGIRQQGVHGQTQRVTTSSILPSLWSVCSLTWKPSSAVAAKMERRA